MGWLYVFIGGGLGSCLRYGISILLGRISFNFPLATITANAIACIAFGFLAGFLTKEQFSDNYKLLLLTGVCGGFSTFSAFTDDTYQLIQEGQLLYAFGNIVLSIVICLGCLLIGYKCS